MHKQELDCLGKESRQESVWDICVYLDRVAILTASTGGRHVVHMRVCKIVQLVKCWHFLLFFHSIITSCLTGICHSYLRFFEIEKWLVVKFRLLYKMQHEKKGKCTNVHVDQTKKSKQSFSFTK